jgi:hypothetical protein
MNSSQVNFFLTPQDHSDLEEKLRKSLRFVAIEERVSGRITKPVIRETLYRRDDSGGACFLMPQDISQVTMRFFETTGTTWVEIHDSPVIEFSRCFFDGSVLRRGRFYAVSRFYRDGELVAKSDSFLKFVKNVMAITRKNLTRDGSDYYGAEALEIRKNGYLAGITITIGKSAIE